MPDDPPKMRESEPTHSVIEEMKHIDHFLHAGEVGGGAGTGSSGGAAAGGAYYAACDSGSHRPWVGRNRGTREAAQADCDSHNAGCDAQGASVVG